MRLSRNQQGSLLLEVLVTVVILAVGLTFIVESMASSLKTLSIGTQYAKSAWLAEQSLCGLVLQKNLDPNFTDSGDYPVPFDQYHYDVRVQPFPQTGLWTDPINEINLVVSWPSGNGSRNLPVTVWMAGPPENKK